MKSQLKILYTHNILFSLNKRYFSIFLDDTTTEANVDVANQGIMVGILLLFTFIHISHGKWFVFNVLPFYIS
jgi:hypothetical protein